MIRSLKSKLLITILVAAMIVAVSGVSVASPANKITATPLGPKITSISPTKHTPGDFSLTIKGQNFGLGAVVSVNDKNKKLVSKGKITSGSKTKLVATIYMKKASPGVYYVNVKNPDGRISNNVKLTIVKK